MLKSSTDCVYNAEGKRKMGELGERVVQIKKWSTV